MSAPFTVSSEACHCQSIGVYQLLFNQLILSLLNATCDIATSYPRDAGTDDDLPNEFDFIVVGAGTTGSIIANRLSENPQWNILLIDAGGDPPIESDIPGMHERLWNNPSTAIANFADESSGFCQGLLNEQCYYIRGKILGGSSSLNGLLYARGNPRDYDSWAAAGNEGWDHASVLRYYRKLETIDVARLRNANHGVSGYQHVGYFPNETRDHFSEIQKSLYRAFKEAKIPYVDDIAVKTVNAVGRRLGTVKHGVRQSAARSYLSTIRDRTNLFLLKRTYVTKVLIGGRERAYGVRVRRNNDIHDFMARKEVIVSAGTIGSAQLLLLSGIGPSEHLENVGVQVVRNLNVGFNFRDHLEFYGAYFSYVTDGQQSHSPETFELDSLYDYFTKRSREFGGPGGSLDPMMFYDSTQKQPEHPDVQFYFNVFKAQSPSLRAFAENYRVKEDIVESLTAIQGDYILAPVITVLRPTIKGRVYLKSADPFASVGIDMDYPRNSSLQTERMERFLAGIRFLERLTETDIFRSKNITLGKVNVKECHGSWECIIRYLTWTGLHMVGTCKMGPRDDPEAVVDATLKVHGIEGLRVADASIMPEVISGNTMMPCMMIGEKAADMIREEWSREW